MTLNKLKTEHGIFTDIVDSEGIVVLTAEEVYKQWLDGAGETPSQNNEVADMQDLIIELSNQIF